MAVHLLLQEEILILPTDTLYGLVGLAYSSLAVEKIFSLKKRSFDKPLPVHYSNIELVRQDCEVTDIEFGFMQKYWPGPLTIVLKKKKDSKLKFCGDSVAVRVPQSDVLLEIIQVLKQPLVVPSANISNQSNIFKFNELVTLFGLKGVEQDALLQQKPSTIISFLRGKMVVLRQGALVL